MKHLLILLPLLIALPAPAQRVREHLKPEGHAHSGGARGSAPANDDCANAQAITVAAACTSPITGNNATATQDGPVPGCDQSGTFIDVWYVFNPGNTDTVSVMLVPANPTTQDWSFALYDGCAGNETFCIVNPAVQMNVPVIPNANNWLRIWANTDYGPGGEFTLCVANQIFTQAPPNDLCANAVPQPVAIGGTATYTGVVTGATDSEGFGSPSVWEAFTLATCADVKINFCGTAPKIIDFWLMLYNACPGGTYTYPGSYDTTACADGNYTLCFANLAPGTYYYPIAATFNNPGAYTMHVSATACGSDQASNDECSGAIALTPHGSCEPAFFTSPCATQSMPAVNCGGFTGVANDDVWYSFVATTADMTVGGAPHGNMDIVMQLFSGTCGSLTSIACGDVNGGGVADDMAATGLTPGNTYYFRVYDFRAQYSAGDPGYDLCVVEGQGSGMGIGAPAEAPGTGLLWPNPGTGRFTLPARGPVSAIAIFDATGRCVWKQAANSASGNVNVDAGTLNPGTYLVRYTEGGRQLQQRLIIQ